MVGKIKFRPIEIIRSSASDEHTQIRVGRDSPYLLKIREFVSCREASLDSPALHDHKWRPVKLSPQMTQNTEILLDVEHAASELGFSIMEVAQRSEEDLSGLVAKAEKIRHLVLQGVPQDAAYKTVSHLESIQAEKLFLRQGQMSETYRHEDLYRTCEIIRNPDTGELDIFLLLNKAGDEILGEGFSTKTKTAVNVRTGEKVAVLSTLGSDEEKLQIIKTEKRNAQIVKGIKGFIPTYFLSEGVSKKHGVSKLRRFQPACDSDLAQAHYNGKLSDDDNKKIALNLLEAIKGFHAAGMLHRDLKMENILLKFHEKSLEVYIADLGFSCNIDDLQARKRPLCNLASVSPEFARAMVKGDFDDIQNATDFKHDVWGLGVLLMDLFEQHLSEEFADAAFAPVLLPDGIADNRDKSKDWELIAGQIGALKSGWLPPPQNPYEKLISSLLEPNKELRPNAEQAFMMAKKELV